MSKIAIVGAGIGGLTTAHALRQAGYNIRVFERAEKLRAAGAGITMQANAMAALASIGLDKPIRAAGYPIDFGQVTTWEEKVISEIDIAYISETVNHLGVSIHRARLIDQLADGLQDVLEFGVAVESVENTDHGTRLVLDDGRTSDFDAIIGCDGLHSAVRRSLFGAGSLRYAGYTTWRGIAKMPVDDIVFTEMWGPGCRFGLVPIADNEVYWFAVDNAPEGADLQNSVMDEMISLFGNWSDSVVRALKHTDPEEIIRTDCHDRPPSKVWGAGRITLLGDAVHPMTPNLGQGGSQAVESAIVLGRILAATNGTDNIEDALRRYEIVRKPRARRFVDQSWRMGRMSQWQNNFARGLRDFSLRLIPESVSQKMLIDLYDFEGWYEEAQNAANSS